MSNYTKNTNFTAKDNLTSGDPAKVIKGAEFDTEFNALQTAVNSKADSNNSQLTGTTDAQAVETTGDVTVGGNLSVTGNATIAGNLTFGDADTDTVSFSADVDSNILPNTDATYDLGSATKEWRDLYVDGTAYVDTVNLNGSNITATAAELNVLDGITATTAELNYTDGVTSNIQTQLNGKATTAQGALADSAVQPNDNVSFGTGSFSGEIAANGGIALGDNDKATFGAGDDLQIYHDGSNSYIKDDGTGQLVLEGSGGVYINATGTGESMAGFNKDGAVDLYHNNSKKLATTSTGVDVTGTVTADGLTVGDANRTETGTLGLDYYNSNYYIASVNTNDSDNTNGLTLESGFNGDILFKGYNGFTSSTKGEGVPRLKILDGGDVHLYEDTGTTAKFVWDASEEQLSVVGSVTGKAPFRTFSGGYTSDYNSYSAEEGFQVMSYQTDGGSPYTKTSDLVANADGTAPSEMRLFTKANGSSSPTERMRIDSSGNVGIGTDSPSGNLVVSNGGAGGVELTASYSGTRNLLLNYNRSSPSYTGLDFDATDYIFYGSGSERARIDSSGKLLVNTTTTLTFGDAKFQAKGDTNFWSGTFESSSTVSGRGCVGFVVQNTVAPFARFNHGNILVGTISTNGLTTNYGTTSDYRLKENVVAMDNASDKVKALKPCRFNFIANPDTTVDGFLAHEAQEVVPEAVTGTKDAVDAEGNPEYQGIDQSKLVPLLTKALQEAITKIEQLETRIETLENN